MEDKIRKQIANRITRGKVEVSVAFSTLVINLRMLF